MHPPKLLLERLPTELLSMIKDNLDEHDLVEHFNFSVLTSRTAALYSDRCWERLCHVSGLGVLPDEESGPKDWNWYGIARECALHAQQCTHPGCGKARLEENVKAMVWYQDSFPEHDLAVLTLADEKMEGWPCSVYEHIAFRRDWKASWPYGSETCVAYLRPATKGRPNNTIEDHPIAQRTFATFPPVNEMGGFTNLICGVKEAIRAKGGVTIAHVLQWIIPDIMEDLSIGHVKDLIRRVDYQEVFPQSWSTLDRFQSLEKSIDWFRLVVWNGFYPVGSNCECRIFDWDFDVALGRLPMEYKDMPDVDNLD